ncbi:MAG: AAA family ATPase [Myxococcales bacterium]|nr:AAA family ATPase [Myxococcales bacterium]MDD9966108.1 AAA family ATPase [Myxococcales bacterium]
MYVLLNGAFGVGKTTVARALRGKLASATLFDPEWVGLALMRLPGYARSDFQHLSAWRRLSVLGARVFAATREVVIIPMAFSELRYLDEVRSGLAASRRPVLHFCLTAPLDVVRARLAARGEPAGDPSWAWVHRRAEECCLAHAAPAFAVHVPTEDATPEALAEQLAERITARSRHLK